MKRLFDWRSRLTAQINVLKTVPCIWGSSDCAYNTSALVEAMTGENLVPEGLSYSTPEGAVEAIASLGFANLPALVASKLEEIPVSMARAGDVALIDAPITGGALGLFMSDHIVVTTPLGLGIVSRDLANKAYKVP